MFGLVWKDQEGEARTPKTEVGTPWTSWVSKGGTPWTLDTLDLLDIKILKSQGVGRADFPSHPHVQGGKI